MMMGTAIETPDITYDALIKEGFTDATIRRAIREGLDGAGKRLDDPMPRCQMTDPDAQEAPEGASMHPTSEPLATSHTSRCCSTHRDTGRGPGRGSGSWSWVAAAHSRCC